MIILPSDASSIPISGKKDFRCALIGEHLGHSDSPMLHAMIADHSYELCEVPPDRLGVFLQSDAFDALNVTIPYKEAVLPYLSRLTDRAAQIGAVNCIKRTPEGLIGDNTDASGFAETLRRARIAIKGKKVLLLGTGGASRAVRWALERAGASVFTVSRKGNLNYGNCTELCEDADLIVNATPVGMYPNSGTSPLDLSGFHSLSAVIDLIYNPLRTALLLDAEQRGIPADNGAQMLAAQAVAACEFFHGVSLGEELSSRLSDRICDCLTAEKKNILLIGMPGCGKSTVGALAAERLNRAFYDADVILENRVGMSCAEVITREGEEAFRKRESEVLRELGAKRGCVIAAGGGAVTRRENLIPIRENSLVCFLTRETEALATDGRPLSQQRGTEALYRERLPFYHAFADCTVANNTPESAADKICEVFRSLRWSSEER